MNHSVPKTILFLTFITAFSPLSTALAQDSASPVSIIVPVVSTDGSLLQQFKFAGNAGNVTEQSAFDLLSNPSVSKDLELVDDQQQQVNAMQAEYGKQITNQMNGLRDGSISGEEYTQFLISQKLQRKNKLNEFLLPHQLKRLHQIKFQMQTSGVTNLGNAASNETIVKQLGLSPKQQKALKEKADEIRERVAQEIKQMRADAKEELLGVLTDEQRKKFAELSGSKYQEHQKDWQAYIKQHTDKKNLP